MHDDTIVMYAGQVAAMVRARRRIEIAPAGGRHRHNAGPAYAKARRRSRASGLACTGAHTGASTQGAPFGDVNFGEKEELR